MNEFVNSRSMLTPGVAGALVMVLANSLSSAFAINVSLSTIVLILSFLLGMIVLSDDKIKLVFRFPLYILNSLIIFSMAFGSNSLGKKIDNKSIDIIEPEIKPITSTDDFKSVFLFTQRVSTDTARNNAKIRKEALKSQIVTISNSLLLIQNSIVSNQKEFTNPQNKMKQLVQINDLLLNINKAVEKDTLLKANEFVLYQKDISEVQHNAQVLQGTLLVEKNKQVKQERFFKDWN